MVFIDGFNLYHFLNGKHYKNPDKHYKWINYRSLAKSLLPSNSEIISIKYFSAYAKWDRGKVTRHRLFKRILEDDNIEIRMNKFQAKSKNIIIDDSTSSKMYTFFGRTFPGKRIEGYTHEEKQTDVDIGVQMYRGASKGQYDIALLISGDTDFEPVLKQIKADYPKKWIIVAVPNKNIPRSIREIVGNSNCRLIKNKHLNKCILQNPHTLKDGILHPIS